MRTETSPTKAQRDAGSARMVGLDLARSLAVIGMVVVNFKTVMGASASGPAFLIRCTGLIDGRAVAVFITLAGIGIALGSGGASGPRDEAHYRAARRTVLRRALFLFVLGLLLAPVWPADILHFYGVYMAISAFLLRARPRRLLTYAGLGILVAIALILTLDYERGWDWSTLDYSGFWTPGGMLRHLFFNGFHPVFPWIGFLLTGMALGRLDLRDSAVRRVVLRRALLIAVLAEATGRLVIARFSDPSDPAGVELLQALFGSAPMPPTWCYMLGAGGTACVVILLCIEIGERFRGAPWLAPFVATGQLALSLYVAHIFVGMGLLDALGRLQDQDLPFALAAAAAFCVPAVLLAWLWRKRFARGPFEAAMRRLTA